MFTFATPSTFGYIPPSCAKRLTRPKYLSLYPPSSTSGGGDKEGGILEERYVNMSEIPKRGPRYRDTRVVEFPYVTSMIEGTQWRCQIYVIYPAFTR